MIISKEHGKVWDQFIGRRNIFTIKGNFAKNFREHGINLKGTREKK